MGRMIDVDALKKHIEEVIKKQNGKIPILCQWVN